MVSVWNKGKKFKIGKGKKVRWKEPGKKASQRGPSFMTERQ